MSFPYMNAQSLSQTFGGIKEAAATTIPFLATGQHNMAQMPGVIDVSGMEFAFSLMFTSATGAPARFLITAASTAVFVMADGGPTGDATGGAGLFAGSGAAGLWSNSLNDGGLGSTASPNQPLDAAGSSSTDLDADDWLNLRVIANATGLVGIASVHANYIYGKPGGIA